MARLDGTMTLIGQTTQTHGTTARYDGASGPKPGQGPIPVGDPSKMGEWNPVEGRWEIKPQPGKQEEFIKTRADIAVYGGGAGGGKTWALLLDPLRNVRNPAFAGVVFRRTYPQIKNEGGLWDESFSLYQLLGAKPKETNVEWTFPSGATIRFAHMALERNKYDWQGSQIPFIAFDELTHFTESQFFYMLSRSRSMSGVNPYIRATCNPDAGSWVKKFLAPWVDSTSPIKAASGEVLYMIRDSGEIYWYRFDELSAEQKTKARSVTFIAASIYDNKKLLEQNPEYLANLQALPPVEQARLLHGDWDIMPTAGKVFNKAWAVMMDTVPGPLMQTVTVSIGTNQYTERHINYDAPYSFVRFWDLAATEKELEGDDPDFTAGVKLLRVGHDYVVVNVIHGQFPAGEIQNIILDTARRDGIDCAVRWEIEGGSSGKILNHELIRKLAAFDAAGVRPQGSKLTRFKAVSQAAANGSFGVLRSEWAEAYLNELHHFPEKGWHDDMVDATSGAFLHASVMGINVWTGPEMFSTPVQPGSDDAAIPIAEKTAYNEDSIKAGSFIVNPFTGMPDKPATEHQIAESETVRARSRRMNLETVKGWIE